jgi:hypothetical protein
MINPKDSGDFDCGLWRTELNLEKVNQKLIF